MREKTAKASAGGQPARRKRRTAEEIRKRLLRAARDEFRKKGFAGATTAAIASRAGVAEIQMFRYYPSKAELFREAILTPLKEHFRAFNAQYALEALDQEEIREKAQLYAAQLQSFLADHAGLLISLFVVQTYEASSKDEASRIRDDLQAWFDECAEVMVRRTGYVSDTDPGTMVRVAFGALLGCITYKDWLFPTGRSGVEAVNRAMIEFVLNGIGPHSDIGVYNAR